MLLKAEGFKSLLRLTFNPPKSVHRRSSVPDVLLFYCYSFSKVSVFESIWIDKELSPSLYLSNLMDNVLSELQEKLTSLKSDNMPLTGNCANEDTAKTQYWPLSNISTSVTKHWHESLWYYRSSRLLKYSMCYFFKEFTYSI